MLFIDENSFVEPINVQLKSTSHGALMVDAIIFLWCDLKLFLILAVK